MKLEQLLSPTSAGGEGWTTSQLAAAIRKQNRVLRTDASTIGRLCSRMRGSGAKKQRRQASLPLALAIEKATAGLVRAEEVPMGRGARRLLEQLRQSPPEGAECAA